MKLFTTICFVALVFIGCVQKDPINNLVKQESSDPAFMNGPIKLFQASPEDPLEDLVKHAFENVFPHPLQSGTIKIITNRNVIIQNDPFTAVLVETQNGRKVVLLRYINLKVGWWSKVYNTDD